MELAGEMRRLMEDKKLREVLGSNARNLVEEYSWENSVKNWIQFILCE